MMVEQFIATKVDGRSIIVYIEKYKLNIVNNKLVVKIEILLPVDSTTGNLITILRFDSDLGLLYERLTPSWGALTEDSDYRKKNCYFYSEAETWDEALFEAREYAMRLLDPLIKRIEKRKNKLHLGDVPEKKKG